MEKQETFGSREPTNEDLKSTISKNLKKLMKRDDIKNQAGLSRKCGISTSTISKILNGHILTPKNALIISKSCGVSLDFLYGNSEYEDISEDALEIVKKHISPALYPKTFHDGKYSIKTIRFSQCYSTYLNAVFDMLSSSIPEEARDMCLKKAEAALLASLQNDQEKPIEYALIPIDRLHNQLLLEDLGISQENQQLKSREQPLQN